MIRYCSTPSGRVAYSTMGAGPPLLFDSGWTTHLQRQLQLFSFGDFVRRLAEHFTVIRYATLVAACPTGTRICHSRGR
jgi:hypothetical protein